MAFGQMQVGCEAEAVGVHVCKIKGCLSIPRLSGDTVMMSRRLEVERHALSVVVAIAKTELRSDIPLPRRQPVKSKCAFSKSDARYSRDRALRRRQILLVEQKGDVMLGNLVPSHCKRCIEVKGLLYFARRESVECIRESSAPRTPLSDCLEKADCNVARRRGAQPIQVHLSQVIKSQRMALMCRECEVVQCLVKGLAHTHAGDIHRTQIKLCLCIATFRGFLEQLQRRRVRDWYSVTVHVHEP
mmetsp:Transcript_13484/g.40924  ORF Transcript_13484/g.40924 Transcript_13484/m.40924 type:complete len:244 (+) Transcript_13484:660-1391(+)